MSNEFKDWYNDFTDIQKKNYELCMKYPIIIPHNVWTGEVVKDYNYEYTKLDSIPPGWRSAFGDSWARDVQKIIDKLPEEIQDKIYIMDLKEKYGQFRQYFSYYNNELDEIISQYERLSERTCLRCGAPATKISMGWIYPWCDTCAEKIPYKMVSVDEWFKEDDENGDN